MVSNCLARRGSATQMAEDLVDHPRIVDRSDDLKIAAVVGQRSMSRLNASLSSRAQLLHSAFLR